MIAPTNIFKLKKLEDEYMYLNSFIRSLYEHIEFENYNYQDGRF